MKKTPSLWLRWTYLKCLSVVFLLAFCPGCFGQRVKIRVVNIADGRPLRDQPVEISMLRPGVSTALPDLRLVTDANGEVQFELQKPVPTRFYVAVKLSDAQWYCDCWNFFTTQDVIQKGFISKFPHGEGIRQRTEDNMKPTPTEILFRAQATPWWVRLLYPIMKQ